MQIETQSDYEGYFENLVRSWVASKPEHKHVKVVITAGPYRPDAVKAFYMDNDRSVLHLDFYSAIRRGFGSLSESEIDEIVEIL